jgi:phenylacetate-CoA ligase
MKRIDIYYKLPTFAQNLACHLEGRKVMKARYSQEFWKCLENYESRNNWTYEQLCYYRDSILQKMIKHCYDTVPYYKKLFDELGVDYKTIKSKEDLKVLPILTKQIIKVILMTLFMPPYLNPS